MKNMRKLFAMVLAVMMVMSLATTAFAAEGDEAVETGTITINDAVVGQTYTVYQILDLESYSGNAYSYKATTAWSNFINSEAIKGVYVNVDAQGYVTWVEGKSAAEFAKLAQAYAKTNSIAASATAVTATTKTVEFTGLDLGYYLVDTTLGTLCSLDTTNPNVVMEEKNEAPTVEKEVKEDSTNAWGATNDADINQKVEFQATITVEAGAENYKLRDKMSSGLTFNNDVTVTVDGQPVDASNYTVDTTDIGEYTFIVEFDNDYIDTLTADTKIVVSYSGTLNENAVVGLPGNPNEVDLGYGDETKPSWTPKDTTTTYTWDMKVVKYTENTKDDGTKEEINLSGATFKLSTDDKGENVLKFHNLGENKYEVCADAACTKEHVTEITTDTTGTFHIEGLDAGTYYLTETAAPAGYNKLAGAITVTITGATGEGDSLTYTTVEQKVLNQSGTELPSTGGMGTTLFYVFGGIMVLAAVILLVTKRRMNIAE